jgi:hypothetical protein
MRLLQDAFRHNDQEIAVWWVANDAGPGKLAQIVQPMLSEHNVPQVFKPQNTTRTALFGFFLFSAQRTL